MATLEQLKAEREQREAAAKAEKEANKKTKTELPAAGKGAGVKSGENVMAATERNLQPQKDKPVPTTAPEKVVPKTTAAADPKAASKPADKEFKK
jgi:hypothetical protein